MKYCLLVLLFFTNSIFAEEISIKLTQAPKRIVEKKSDAEVQRDIASSQDVSLSLAESYQDLNERKPIWPSEEEVWQDVIESDFVEKN